ncbi:MAG: hypothetical protein QM652_02480 [Legionella sp.]|uniref:hypothetical protein n=1 Tax=Legionella sp. TaxID=459 RepID=UPI0039E55AEC
MFTKQLSLQQANKNMVKKQPPIKIGTNGAMLIADIAKVALVAVNAVVAAVPNLNMAIVSAVAATAAAVMRAPMHFSKK